VPLSQSRTIRSRQAYQSDRQVRSGMRFDGCVTGE
jgi:hypothetical protein